MLKLPLTTLLTLFISFVINAQVGVGTTTPHSSAILDITSNSKGFLPPRLTIAERNIIDQPVAGLLIYNKSISCIETYNGNYWFNHCCSKIVNSGLSNVTENTVVELQFDNLSDVLDNDGNDIVSNGYVNSIQSIEGNNYTFSEVHNSEAAMSSSADTLFKFIVTNHDKPPYTAKHFIKRTRSREILNGYGVNNYLTSDIPDIENNDFEIFLVARFSQPGVQNDYASIFHTRKWGPQFTEIAESFQISSGHSGIGTSDQYNFRYGGVNGHTGVLIDDKFHVFNIKYTASSSEVIVFIDGTEVYTTNTALTVKQLSLFTNRNAASSPKSEIGSFVLYDSILSDNSRETVNAFLLCKYGDL